MRRIRNEKDSNAITNLFVQKGLIVRTPGVGVVFREKLGSIKNKYIN